MPQKTLEIVGVDLIDNSIKAVVGTKSGDKIIISKFAHKRILSNTGGSGLDNMQVALRELLLDCGIAEKAFKKVKVRFIVPGSKVCVRVVKLPLMSREEIHQALKVKIKEFISYPLDEMLFDFSPLGEVQERGIKKSLVVFIAIQQKELSRFLKVFEDLGIAAQLATSPCFCGLNLMNTLGITKPDSSFILINIADAETDISVFRKGNLVFTRNISFGEKNFIEGLKNELNISSEKAEEIEHKYGITAGNLPEDLKLSPEQICRVLEAQADILFRELDLTAHHYYQSTHGESIDRYFILGQGSRLKGLGEFLSHKLDITVEHITIPEVKLDVSSGSQKEFKDYMAGYCLALGAIVSEPSDINLISSGRQKIRQRLSLVNFFSAPGLPKKLIIIFLSLTVGIFAYLKGLNLYYKNRIKSNQAKWEHLQDRLNGIIQLKRNIDSLEYKKKLFLGLKEKSAYYPGIIFQICKTIPQGQIFLEELMFSKNASGKIAFALTGRVSRVGNYSPTDFMLALENTGYFEGLSLTTGGDSYAEPEAGAESAFTIRGEIRLKE